MPATRGTKTAVKKPAKPATTPAKAETTKPPAKVAKGSRDLGPLIAEVRARPADDAARAVYADALVEASDSQGEFIHLQLRSARGIADEAGYKRRKALEAAHAGSWLGAAQPFVRSKTFTRGLVSQIVTEAALVLQGFDAICDLVAPDLVLVITGIKPTQIPQLAKLRLGRIRRLWLGENRLLDSEVIQVAPALVGATELDLSNNGRRRGDDYVFLTSACLPAVAAAAPGLTRLGFVNNALDAAGVDLILGTWKNLESLTVGRRTPGVLTDADARRLVDGLPKLRSLSISEPQLSPALCKKLEETVQGRATP